jgi:uncharacterized GH25 family protein
MKKVSALVVLSLCMAVPSFGAEHVVTHTTKVVGKDSYRAVAISAKDVGKAGKAAVKFII